MYNMKKARHKRVHIMYDYTYRILESKTEGPKCGADGIHLQRGVREVGGRGMEL